MQVVLVALLLQLQLALAQQTFSGSNSIPDVTLLIDNAGTNSSKTIRSLLDAVAAKRGSPFYFGVAYDRGSNTKVNNFAISRLNDTFNLGVAENNCKWTYTEPSRNVSDLTACKQSRDFFTNHSASFRLHNTFWHEQTPSWLPGSFSASELVNDIIPVHVRQEAGGMGDYVSVDVLNEIVGDQASSNMSAYDCVASKMSWPTTMSDTDSTPYITDLSWVESALRTAAQSTNATLLLNDYSIGGNNAKTACYYTLAQALQGSGVAVGGIGFQSHVAAKSNNFDAKETLKATFAQFAAIGLSCAVTEFDVWVQDNSTASLRWQAAIYGDYLDACLYSPNCHEFLVWGLYDAVSWLNTFPDRGVAMPLLFDANMVAKLNYHEVRARLQRYLDGTGEVCASASGSAVCDLRRYAANSSASTSPVSSVARSSGTTSRVTPLSARSTASSTRASVPSQSSTVVASAGGFHAGLSCWLLIAGFFLVVTAL